MSLSNELMRILGELTTNWRDIRNIVRLARGLTAGDGGRIISVRHIMTAVSIIRSEDSGEMLEETKRVSSNVDVWLEKQTKQLRVHTPYSEGE
jgi:predicted ATP-dependent protease